MRLPLCGCQLQQRRQWSTGGSHHTGLWWSVATMDCCLWSIMIIRYCITFLPSHVCTFTLTCIPTPWPPRTLPATPKNTAAEWHTGNNSNWEPLIPFVWSKFRHLLMLNIFSVSHSHSAATRPASILCVSNWAAMQFKAACRVLEKCIGTALHHTSQTSQTTYYVMQGMVLWPYLDCMLLLRGQTSAHTIKPTKINPHAWKPTTGKYCLHN